MKVLIVHSLLFCCFGHLEGGLEDVDAVDRGAHQHLEVDRVVADLFYLLLALVNEHQLVGHLRLLILVLHRHVPDSQPVVLARHGDHGFLVGLELDRGNWF